MAGIVSAESWEKLDLGLLRLGRSCSASVVRNTLVSAAGPDDFTVGMGSGKLLPAAADAGLLGLPARMEFCPLATACDDIKCIAGSGIGFDCGGARGRSTEVERSFSFVREQGYLSFNLDRLQRGLSVNVSSYGNRRLADYFAARSDEGFSSASIAREA